MNRKSFLKLTTRAGLFLGVTPTLVACSSGPSDEKQDQLEDLLKAEKVSGSLVGFKTAPIPKVRVGMIGLGNRGSTLIQMFEYLVKNNHAELVALSDLKQAKVEKNNDYVKSIQGKGADLYYGSEDKWKELAERDDIDLIVIATPWEHHAKMSIYGMEQGKDVACEVPIAYTMKDSWDIIKTAERTKKHCFMLENCCYNNEELWVLNMINEGVFGEVNHAEGAYIHDLKAYMLTPNQYENDWRLKHHEQRDGNFYTTHGLGPISGYMDIGRGDNYDHLVSMSSKEHSLSSMAKAIDHPSQKFKCGDMNTTLLKTKLGKTMMLQFDVHTGRPYSRLNTVTGSKAVHQGYPSKLYIAGDKPEWSHSWLDKKEYDEYRKLYNHPLWSKLKSQINDKTIGHGGMDFVMIYRLIRSLNQGIPLDINVYDGVMWSAITPLSEISVANRSNSVTIPDFTGNTWEKKRKNELLRSII